MTALDEADALIICTDWDEFKHPDLAAMRRRMKAPVIFDGRNLYRSATLTDAGFTYYSVGRAVAQPLDIAAQTRAPKTPTQNA